MQSGFRTKAGAKQRAAGFTLLEVLVSMLLIAIGVLGTAGLQALAYKVNQGGQLRSQAVILGLDFIERVEANNDATIAGGYAPATYPATAAKDCSTAFCTPTELATYDLVAFKANVLAQLPAAAVTVSMTGTGPYSYTVRIDWEERITKGSGTTVATSGTTTVASTGKTETFSYSITRMFQNRSLII
jgi:type IV pilus assembly protein PilV